MPMFKASMVTFWYAMLFAELVVWAFTVCGAGWIGLLSFTAFILIIPTLLAVEGLELAVASLLNSEANLPPAAVRELDLIKADRALPFFPNRQMAVVASIVVLTLASGFERIHIPGVGWTSRYNLPTIFNLVFPTHMVLLLAQVPGKMLALYAPARFFEHTWRICVGIRWIGSLELTAPAKPLTNLLARFLGYPLQHRQPVSGPRLVYPVYDHIDSCWYYFMPPDEADAADAR